MCLLSTCAVTILRMNFSLFYIWITLILIGLNFWHFTIIFEQRTLFIVHCRIHNRIVPSLFSCSYLSLHIVRETVTQIHGIFSPISSYLFKLMYLLDQCFSNHTVQNTHGLWETQIDMINWGIERPPNLPKLCSWEESQWELAPET